MVAGLKKAVEILDYWYNWLEFEKKDWFEKSR